MTWIMNKIKRQEYLSKSNKREGRRGCDIPGIQKRGFCSRPLYSVTLEINNTKGTEVV